jgi:uncharacterized protein YjbJ (UPF0337 family)
MAHQSQWFGAHPDDRIIDDRGCGLCRGAAHSIGGRLPGRPHSAGKFSVVASAGWFVSCRVRVFLSSILARFSSHIQGYTATWCGRWEEGRPMGLDDKVKNKAEEISGKTKKRIGRAIGDRNLEAEGRAGQVKSRIKQTGEKIKDATKNRRTK